MNPRARENQYRDSGNLSARAALHARYSTNPQGWANWLFQQLALCDGESVLEVGCGPGGLWRSHVRELPACCRLILTDLSPGMVDEAWKSLRDDRFSFRVADAQALPFAAASFDCVTANHMLYEVADPAKALAEIARVLKPTGRLCAATNGAAHMQELHDLIRASVPSFCSVCDTFSLENGEALLRRRFADVALRRYEDSLIVPDADALSAYVRSMGSLSAATEAELAALDRAIHREVAIRGSLRIAKDSGLFIASGRAPS